MNRPLLDRARAEDVLRRHGLDALLLSHPLGVYHATGYDVPLVAARHSAHAGALALVPRDPRQPVGLIMAAPHYYARHAQTHHDDPDSNGDVAAFQYDDGSGEAAIYRDRELVPLDPLERARASAATREAAARPPQPSALAAVRSAARDLGIGGGRIGVDAAAGSPERAVLAAALPSAALMDGEASIADLRKLKSARELALLRVAQRNTAEAALVAARSARAGASFRELRAVFATEVARRGNLPVWMVVDRAITDSWHGELRDGQVFYIDCVSQYAGYHGDYGRTVSLGEPGALMRRTTQAIHAAWESIRERLRPGLTYGEIRATGQAALRRVDAGLGVRITPHSVGLQHTDLAYRDDMSLEAGMVLSVDCPVIDTGIGGSAHREDLVLITPTGFELLNDPGEELIVV
jgi:Xaa-Pro aminopeptidase